MPDIETPDFDEDLRKLGVAGGLLADPKEMRRNSFSSPIAPPPTTEAMALPGIEPAKAPTPVAGEAAKPQTSPIGAPEASAMPADRPLGANQPAAIPSASPVASSAPAAPAKLGQSGMELERLKKTGSGIDQLQKSHPVLGTIARIGDVLGSTFLPGLTAQIPGTSLHHRMLESQAAGGAKQENAQATSDAENAQRTATTAETNARIPLTQAQTAEAKARTAEIGNPKPKEEKWTVVGKLPDGRVVQHEENSGQFKTTDEAHGVEPLKEPTPHTPNDFEQFYADYIKENNFPDTSHNRLLARKAYAAAGQAPQHDPRQMAVGPDGTVIELKPGMKVPQGSKTVTGDLTNKPSADEQKRADLVENLNENLDQLEDIVGRRPDLFGKVAGRTTKFREWVGSDDPDIAALKGIEDRLGMVQQSSHGMRSAQHVEASANSLLNGFKNGTDAMKKAIADARASGKTFTQDAQRDVNRGSTGGGDPVYATNPKTKERVMSTDGGKTWQPAK